MLNEAGISETKTALKFPHQMSADKKTCDKKPAISFAEHMEECLKECLKEYFEEHPENRLIEGFEEGFKEGFRKGFEEGINKTLAKLLEKGFITEKQICELFD